MNRYSRVFHHISLEDVKRNVSKNYQKNKSFLESISNTRKFLRDLNSPHYSDWRNIKLKESMNTSNVFVTTFPATGDSNLENIDANDADVYTAAGGLDALNGTSIRSNGSGSGQDGGFDVGQSYLGFDGDTDSRHAILDPIDSSKFDTVVIRGIVGNDNNGGEDPDVSGEELRLYYLDPNGSSFRSISVNPSGDQILPTDSDIIIPLGAGLSGTLQNFSINLPSHARGEGFTYMLKQLSNSGSDFDHYGITNIRYQRKGPVSLVVSLDSPEAVAFIRDGSGGLTPEEKKKRLEDMLAASDEYIDTAFPENKIISDRIKDQIEQTIALTDREKFEDVQRALMYDETVPEKTQIEAASASYRQDLENQGLRPGEFGAIDFYDWFKEQPEFIDPSSKEVNYKDFDPKSYQASQQSAEVQFWSDPAKLAANTDIQKLFDKNDFTLDNAFSDITSRGRIPGSGTNKEDDSYIDGDPRQKQAVYNWATNTEKVDMSGTARIGYTNYPVEDYYELITNPNSYDWAEMMMRKHMPHIRPGDGGTMEYVYYFQLQGYSNVYERNSGGRYGPNTLATSYNDMIVGYHDRIRKLYDLSKKDLTGYRGAIHNAILDSLQGFMGSINPGNITGKGALFGDTWADYYWGTYVPEPIDKTLPGFMYKVLDDEELVSNFSSSEQQELRDLAYKFNKAEEFVGYDPNADVDAYSTLGSAALNYSVPIAKSILTNRPIVIDPDTIPPQYIQTIAASLTTRMFIELPNYTRDISIVSSPVPYADENIFVGPNGKVQSNLGPNGEKAYYKKDNTMQPFDDLGGVDVPFYNKKIPIFGQGNALAAQGQAQYQMVIPKDDSEPYLYYMDHAYHNVTSDNPGEVPDYTKKALSWGIHTVRDLMQMASGKIRKTSPDQELSNAPNTGAMAGYPPNIRGDVITHVKIPMSDLSPEIQKMIKSEYIKIGLGGTKTLQDDDINPAQFIDPVTGRLGSYGLDSTTAGTVRGDKKKKVKENYEPKAKHNEKITKKMKSPKEFFNQADIKPIYPEDPPPEMVNGYHPDLVNGEKVSNRFDKLDPQSAKAMPPTGNPLIDKKVKAAAKKPK